MKTWKTFTKINVTADGNLYPEEQSQRRTITEINNHRDETFTNKKLTLTDIFSNAQCHENLIIMDIFACKDLYG